MMVVMVMRPIGLVHPSMMFAAVVVAALAAMIAVDTYRCDT